jgi:hypothetical protein
MPNETVLQLDLPGVKKLKSGKGREVFDPGDRLLFVASQGYSATAPLVRVAGNWLEALP